MPVPNDLTPEDEAEFARYGVPTAGEGREPLSEEPPAQQAPPPPPPPPPPSAEEQAQQRQTFHRQDGKFASREEVEAGQAKPSQAAQPGQVEQPPAGEQQPPAGEQQQQEEARMVPLAALHQERAQRAQMARRLQMAETRMNALLTQQNPQGQPYAPQMPDINEDPAGYILAMEQRLERFEQQRQEETQFREIDNNLTADEQTFASYTPDYQQASDHYVQSRAQELLRFYPAEQAQKLMLQEARQIANEAWKRGMSAAEVIYGLAQARGYNPGMPAREPPQQQQGQQPPPQQQAPANNGPRAQDIVSSVNRGQQASRSLSGGSNAAVADLNATAVLNMSDDEFAQWLGEGPGASRRFATIG